VAVLQLLGGLPVRLHGPGQHWLRRYGLGGGLFFLAYALFEVPSNLVLSGSARAAGSRGSSRSSSPLPREL